MADKFWMRCGLTRLQRTARRDGARRMRNRRRQRQAGQSLAISGNGDYGRRAWPARGPRRTRCLCLHAR